MGDLVTAARVVFGKFYNPGGMPLPVLDAETAESEAVNPSTGGTTTIASPAGIKSAALVSSDTACIASFGEGGTEFLVPANGHILVAVPPGVTCTIDPVA